MVMKKLGRNAAMDGIDLYRRLDQGREGDLISDPARIDAVIADIRTALLGDLQQESTVRGWRAQALFSSLVVALDACDLMTFVDTGDVYYDGDSVKPADYFLHLRSGQRILVDVKSHPFPEAESAAKPVKFSASEVTRLRRFGELFGAEVFVAIYYSSLPMWALVSLDDLEPGPEGGYRIAVAESLKLSQISLLGDIHIGIEGPLEMVVRPNPSEPNAVDADGHAQFTIGQVEFRAGDRTLRSPAARRLVSFLMLHGGWEIEEHAETADGQLVALRWVATPEGSSGEGFELIGSLASMYSRLFESSTRGTSGVTSLDVEVEPGMLISMVPHDYESDDLPLWRFVLQPNRD